MIMIVMMMIMNDSDGDDLLIKKNFEKKLYCFS